MKRRKKDKRSREERAEKTPKTPWHADLYPETKKSIFAILAFVVALLFALSYTGTGGSAGLFIYSTFSWLLGSGYFFVPVALILIGFSFLFSGPQKIVGASLLGGTLFLFTILGGLSILFGSERGGLLGSVVSSPLLSFFDFWLSLVITAGLLLISILLIFNMSLMRRANAVENKEESSENTPEELPEDAKTILKTISGAVASALEKAKGSGTRDTEAPNADTTTIDDKKDISAPASAKRPRDEPDIAIRKLAKKFDYKKPPLELLQADRGKPSSGDIKANANIIKRTLENFGIVVEMGEISIGPTVTQYTLRPAEGVKLSKITGLSNDISLALAAHPIRIEAPIPGKSLVGIEVPNKAISVVGLKTLLESETYQSSTKSLLFALGRDVAGTPIYADLAKMPHLLVSGATGSGKSVAMHSIITSLLYRNPPEMLRFIVVDPKRVELSIYNDIPHLLTPVITDAKKTIQAFRWATKEMDRRYDVLSEHHARDIESYNVIAAKNAEDPMPYLLMIVDELADLMALYPREMESSIVRLAQMARAVGIHLLLATQRPSVEVLTGLIKANITSRIALQVASQVDSRTILDISGAEKLLGNGDMLFLAGDTARPRRIQGAFVTEQEVKKVVGFLREEHEAPEYNEGILNTKLEEGQRGGSLEADDEFSGTDDDPLLEEAKDIIVKAGKASASYLQRRLRIGYARAARLLDLLEAQGVIGPGDGAKPREILIQSQTHPALESDEDEILES